MRAEILAERWALSSEVRRYVHVGIRALDWRRPASREGRDASQERTLILNRGPSCSERQSNERVFRGRITVVHPTDSRADFSRSTARVFPLAELSTRLTSLSFDESSLRAARAIERLKMIDI